MREFLEGEALVGRTIESFAEGSDDDFVILLSGNAYTRFVAYGEYVSLYQSGFRFGGYTSDYEAEKYVNAGLWNQDDLRECIARNAAEEAADEERSRLENEEKDRREYQRLAKKYGSPGTPGDAQ